MVERGKEGGRVVCIDQHRTVGFLEELGLDSLLLGACDWVHFGSAGEEIARRNLQVDL